MSDAIFKAGYIRITWNSFDKKSKAYDIEEIIEYQPLIPIVSASAEHQVDGILEISTYPQNSMGQFAITFDGEPDFDEKPHFVNAEKNSENTIQMLKINAKDANKYWWIEYDVKGLHKDGYMNSKLRNHIETTYLKFTVNNKPYIYQINIIDQSLKEGGAKLMLDEFKSELDHLIYNPKGISSNNQAQIQTTNQFLLKLLDKQLINDFINSVESTTKNLHKTLHSANEVVSVNKIKPTLQTFIEYAHNPSKRHYTTTVYAETVNNPVNGYLLQMVKNVKTTLQAFLEWGIEKQLTETKEPIKAYENLTEHDLESMIKGRIHHYKNAQEDHQQFLNKKLAEQPFPTIRSNDRFTSLEGEMTKNGTDYTHLSNNIRLGRTRSDIIQYLEIEVTYRILGQSEHYDNNSYYFSRIDELVVLNYPSKSEEIEKLNNILSQHDKKQKISQFDTIIKDTQNQINKKISSTQLEAQKKQLEAYRLQLSGCINRLNQLENQLDKEGVNASITKPNSMVFLNTPTYAKVFQFYQQLDTDKTLHTMQLSHQIYQALPLTNLPQIYERWCLLKIIRILTEVYRFEPKQKSTWQHLLLTAFKEHKFNVCIEFENKTNNCELHLIYECNMTTEKTKSGECRPDFVIYYKQAMANGWSVLVMDAKFYSGMNILKTLNDLSKYFDSKKAEYTINNKNNWLYILTNTDNDNKGLIRETTSFMDWRRYAYYGEKKLNKASKYPLLPDPPNHQYGGIFLHPDKDKYPKSIDHLQRLLGMFLAEHGFHACIACGGILKDITETKKSGNESKSRKYKCVDCRHILFKTNCHNCPTDLRKQNTYWTYHMFAPESFPKIGNLACPKCYSTLKKG